MVTRYHENSGHTTISAVREPHRVHERTAWLTWSRSPVLAPLLAAPALALRPPILPRPPLDRRAADGGHAPQHEIERGAHPQLARHAQVAAHAAREIAADRQAEPRALDLARVVGADLHEGLEHRVQLVGRDADAG